MKHWQICSWSCPYNQTQHFIEENQICPIKVPNKEAMQDQSTDKLGSIIVKTQA